MTRPWITITKTVSYFLMMSRLAVQEFLSLPPLFPFEETVEPPAPLLQADLYPPLPLWRGQGTSGERVIWGKKTAEALRSLGKTEATVTFFQEGELSLSEALVLWVGLEASREHWGWKDLATLGQFAREHGIALPASVERKLLGGDRTWSKVEQFQALPPLLQDSVEEGKIDLKTALYVKDTPEEALRLLLSRSEGLTFSERRILLRLFSEVLKRDGLDDEKGRELASRVAGEGNPLDVLRKLRFPELHRLEQRFRSAVQPSIKGTGITVSPPEGFEGNRFEVRFSFENGPQLESKALALQQLARTFDAKVRGILYGDE